MAAARCKECGKPRRGPHNWSGPFYPAGGSNQAIICGKGSCEKRAEEIWLKEEEEESRYQNGNRIFDLNTFTGGKIKVQ
jgi:hypothetical protein